MRKTTKIKKEDLDDSDINNEYKLDNNINLSDNTSKKNNIELIDGSLNTFNGNKSQSNFDDNNNSGIIISGKKQNTENTELSGLISYYGVKVSGRVNFPGIYPIGSATELNKLIQVSGGLLREASRNQIEIFNINKSLQSSNLIYPGGSVYVPSVNKNISTIFFEGAINNPRSIKTNNKVFLSDLINDQTIFTKDANVHFGSIKSKLANSYADVFFAFSPSEVLNGNQDMLLKQGDIVKIYYEKEVKDLISRTPSNSINAIVFKDVNRLNQAGSVEELARNLV